MTILVISALLFCTGIVGFCLRRNAVLMFIFSELMVLGAVVASVGYALLWAEEKGQILGLVLLTTAACEAAMALLIIGRIYRTKRTLDIKLLSSRGEQEE
ncbi:MAG: NADH-quinone oxidoreductase subunit NuoK [Gemmataceae bacterium]